MKKKVKSEKYLTEILFLFIDNNYQYLFTQAFEYPSQGVL
jgi:hypothetical protein